MSTNTHDWAVRRADLSDCLAAVVGTDAEKLSLGAVYHHPNLFSVGDQVQEPPLQCYW